MIYFVTARESGRVKIGFSLDARKRFSKIKTDSPVELTLERVCEGSVEDEQSLHARFAAHRIAGEWFALSPEIEAHMATLEPVKVGRRRKPLDGPLGRWMVANSITQVQLAKAVGTEQPTISRVVRGEREPDFALMAAIAEYTGGAVMPNDFVREWPKPVRELAA